MRFLPFLAALLLAGCASHGFDGFDRFDRFDRSHGSWLDDVGKRPSPPTPMSDAQAAQLSGQAARLQAQAEAIRIELAREKDRTVRVQQYRALNRIGDELRPVERKLEDADRPSRTTTVQPSGG